MKISKSNSKLNSLPTYLIVSYIIMFIVGIILRTYHLFMVGFSNPWGLGGLFLEFARQIFINHYTLPANIPYYSAGGLPFAYPPLPFYIEALLVFTAGLPEFFIVNFLPVFFSIISLILFYFFCRKIYHNNVVALFTFSLFSVLPLCFSEQIEAAGLAESFGTIFSILLLYSFLSYSERPTHLPTLFLTSLIWALSIMASPASAYISVVVFFSVIIRIWKRLVILTGKELLYVFVLVTSAMLISSIYWGTVMKTHGISFFISSFLGQHGESFAISSIEKLFHFELIQKEFILPYLFFIAILIFLYYKDFPILFLAVISGLIPRETWLMGIIGTFVVGYALDKLVIDGVIRPSVKPRTSPTLFFVGIFVMILLVGSPYQFIKDRKLFNPRIYLDDDQIQFLKDFKQKNQENLDAVIIGSWSFMEWAPYLSETTVVNTHFGTEFAPEKDYLREVEDSLRACGDYDCVRQILLPHFSEKLFVVLDLNDNREFNIESDKGIEIVSDEVLYQDRFLCYSLDLSPVK